MHSFLALPSLPALLALVIGYIAATDDFPAVSGPYFGQEPPGMIPDMFAPFLTPSSDHKHSAPSFTPDGTEMYFSVYENNDYPQKIKVTKLKNSHWTAPEIVAFSGVFQDGGPSISADGSTLWFYSKRPFDGTDQPTENANIWYVKRDGNTWGEPQMAPFSSPDDNGGTSQVLDGTVYFSSGTQGIGNDWSIVPKLYTVEPAGSGFSERQQLGAAINRSDAASGYGGACVALDENWLISTAYGPGGRRTSELRLSFRLTDSSWSKSVRMGDMINNGGARFAGLSADGKYLFFESYRSGPEEIYWIDAGIIEFLRDNDLNLLDQMITTLKTDGIDASKTLFDELRDQYSEYYLFDYSLFENAADRLLADGHTTEATLAYQLMQETFPGSFTPFHVLKVAIINGDSKAFDLAAAQLASNSQDTASTVEIELNRLGYELIVASLLHASLKVFELNVRLYPASGNVYDSYAEALLVDGDTTASIENYRKSLQLDPDNANAHNVLERLGVN